MTRTMSRLAISLLAFASFAQQPAASPKPIPMPSDRAADSYRIYSMLLPITESVLTQIIYFDNNRRPSELLLLADTTITVVQPNGPCKNPFGRINPYVALYPTPEQAQDYAEMLDDFDHHCHDRIVLTAESLKLAVPVHVLNQAEQEEFRKTRLRLKPGDQTDPAAVAKYKGAFGLSSFTEVYFNSHHTVAMVYGWGWCGDPCSQGFWTVFGLQNGEWKQLKWRSSGIGSRPGIP